MYKVAKLLLVDSEDNHLVLIRSAHPRFGSDIDLPGGTLEEGESLLETMVREVEEEIGVTVNPNDAVKLYDGDEFSTHGTRYVLFTMQVQSQPVVTVSWEHSSYEWIPRHELLKRSKAANDTYMHMVHHALTGANT